jgi:hypothetical protein
MLDSVKPHIKLRTIIAPFDIRPSRATDAAAGTDRQASAGVAPRGGPHRMSPRMGEEQSPKEMTAAPEAMVRNNNNLAH